MLRKVFWSVGIAILGLLASCHSCERGPDDLLALLPADAAGVVVLPDLAVTIRDVDQLMTKFSVGPAATFLQQGRLELKRLLGFDPLNAEELRALGLAPEKGLAAVPEADGQTLVVAGVSNRKAFEEQIRARALQLLAADQFSESTQNGLKVTTIGIKLGEQVTPRLHYAFAGDFALLAGADTTPARLAELATLKKEASLAGAAWFTGLTGKVPREADVLVVVNGQRAAALGGAQAAALSQHVEGGLVLAFSVAATALDGQLFLGLDRSTGERLAALTSQSADAHLERLLPAESLLALRLQLDLGRALEELFKLEPSLREQLDQALQQANQATGSDVEKAAVRNWTGNAAFGVWLGTSDSINQLIGQLAGQAAEAPPDVSSAFGLLFWAQIRDGAAWVQLLDNVLPLMLEGRTIQVERREAGPLRIWSLSGGEVRTPVHLLTAADKVGLCLGSGCTDKAAALLGGKGGALPAGLSAGSRALFEQPALAVGVLNFARMLDALGELDAGALGKGGMWTKMVIELATMAVRNLRELSGVLRFVPEGVALGVHLEIQ